MNHTESQTEMMLGKAAFITNGTWMENEMQDAPREEGFEFAMAPIPTENADDVHYIFDSCNRDVYTRYEKGVRQLPISIAIRLAELYQVSLDYLVGISDEKRPYGS